MKRRTKEKEIMKAVSVCALSIALFGAAFIGFNQLIFAAETNEVTPLPSATEAVVVSQKTEQVKTEALAEAKTFMAPVLKLIESPEQYRHPIPASAMSMQEAAQIGARYIWDVFDAGIDGMYIQMLYAAHVSQSSTWWFGTVYMEDPENPTQNYLVDVRGVEKLALPIYSFTINAVTGERIDISYMDNTAELTNLYSDSDSIINARMGLVESGWFDMDIDTQIAFAGISDEMIGIYTKTATDLAKAQFNLSEVTFVTLNNIWANGMINGVVDFAILSFTAVDNTGREAIINIPTIDAAFRSINISTQHNDFIPGYYFYDDGSGIG